MPVFWTELAGRLTFNAGTSYRSKFMQKHILSVIALVALFGCGDNSGPDKLIISGTVTFQGAPIEKGQIRFTPTADTKGPTSGAIIENGAYEAKARGGVPIGTHRVQITATRPTGESKPKDLQGLDIIPDPQEQYIPEKYNTQSEITLTVEAGGESTHNFDLE